MNMARLIMNQFRWLDRIVNSKVWLSVASMVFKVTHILVHLWCYTRITTGLLEWFGLGNGNLFLMEITSKIFLC